MGVEMRLDDLSSFDSFISSFSDSGAQKGQQQ